MPPEKSPETGRADIAAGAASRRSSGDAALRRRYNGVKVAAGLYQSAAGTL
jgi:hypothetical protein